MNFKGVNINPIFGETLVSELLVGADDAGGVVSTMTNGDLQLRAGRNETKVMIKANGNVGIGTAFPFVKLHVKSDFSGAVLAHSSLYQGLQAQTDNPNYAALFAVSAGGGDYRNPGLSVFGRFYASGTKSAVVPLQDGQHILLYAEESTEVWFSDYGSVQLADGEATVQIDPEFLQTVNTDKKYHVFLTANGNPIGSLYVDHQTPASFEIRETTGSANIDVSYRIVAKRKDFGDERMKKVALPSIQGSEWKEEERIGTGVVPRSPTRLEGE